MSLLVETARTAHAQATTHKPPPSHKRELAGALWYRPTRVAGLLVVSCFRVVGFGCVRFFSFASTKHAPQRPHIQQQEVVVPVHGSRLYAGIHCSYGRMLLPWLALPFLSFTSSPLEARALFGLQWKLENENISSLTIQAPPQTRYLGV